MLFSFSSFAIKADLTPAEISSLQKGKRVKRVISLKGKSWPQITIMKIIPFTPKQNMDVFSNFEDQKKYIPDLIKSSIIRKVGDNQTDVAFELKMPWPVGNSIYSTKNIIENTGEDYKLTWSLIKSNQMKATEGNVIFEAYDGKTLLTYTNHITPDSSFAGMFKGRVEGDVEKTVKIIIDHLNKTISTKN
jgi:hypothetical protein